MSLQVPGLISFLRAPGWWGGNHWVAITSPVIPRKSTENWEMSNWILWSQEEVAPGGSCLRDERWVGHSVPTRTCGGLSEHFAVKEESQESVGWSLKRLLTS